MVKLSGPVKPFLCANSHDFGAKLEYYVFKHSVDMGIFDKVLHESDLVAKYGWESSSIDQLMIIGNYMIPIQFKWRRTRRRETQGIDNFIKSINYLKKNLRKEVLFGVWSSRIKPFADNTNLLKEEKVVCVSFFENIDDLINMTNAIIAEKLNESTTKVAINI